MTSKVKGTEGIEFPDSTVQGSAAYTKAQSDGPAFIAIPSSQEAFSGLLTNKVRYDNALFNSGDYDTATSKFTPSVSGIYQINAVVNVDAVADVTFVILFKNGVEYLRGQVGGFNPPSASFGNNIAGMVKMNGTSDYLEVFFYTGSNVATSIAFGITQFSGFLARKT